MRYPYTGPKPSLPDTLKNEELFPSTAVADLKYFIPLVHRGLQTGREMATHSNILAWKIPWTDEPGGLQFMRLQRVGHD